MKKSIYSLAPLREALAAANRRYLESISSIDDPRSRFRSLHKICRTVAENDHFCRGFNFFDEEDQHLFEIIARGEFNIRGFQNKQVRRDLHAKNGPQVSRILKRLRPHRLIKKIHGTYPYYLTRLGRAALTAGLKLKHLFLVLELTLALWDKLSI